MAAHNEERFRMLVDEFLESGDVIDRVFERRLRDRAVDGGNSGLAGGGEVAGFDWRR